MKDSRQSRLIERKSFGVKFEFTRRRRAEGRYALASSLTIPFKDPLPESGMVDFGAEARKLFLALSPLFPERTLAELREILPRKRY